MVLGLWFLTPITHLSLLGYSMGGVGSSLGKMRQGEEGASEFGFDPTWPLTSYNAATDMALGIG
jgi:hypothetical protein